MLHIRQVNITYVPSMREARFDANTVIQLVVHGF